MKSSGRCVLRVVEQHQVTRRVISPQSVHCMMGMVIAVFVQRLGAVRIIDVIVTMEVQVVVGSEYRRQSPHDLVFLEHRAEFRHARQQIVVTARPGFIKWFKLVIHASVIFTRQVRLQRQIAFNDETLHSVIIEQVFGVVVHVLSLKA